MRILVTYASKMGGTRGIAAAVAEVLEGRGFGVDLRPVLAVRSLGEFDAIVLGSAVYVGKWRSEAAALLDRIQRGHPGIPVFLFQSGPLADADEDDQDRTPPGVRRHAAALGTTVVTFGGRVEPATAVGFIAKKMAVGPHGGDHRNFDEIKAWATSIADSLVPAN